MRVRLFLGPRKFNALNPSMILIVHGDNGCHRWRIARHFAVPAPASALWLAKPSELGIRMALDAQCDRFLQLVLLDGLLLRPALFDLASARC